MANYKQLSPSKKYKFWQDHIDAWRESEQSQTEYCNKQKIKKSTLGYWQNKLAKQTEFIEIPVELEKRSVIEIIITDKVKLKVTKGFDPDLLLQTIKVLEQL
jgi:hypothetical protein